jgi:hypothetical protein
LGSSTAAPSFVPTEPGTYRFALVVNDGEQNSRPNYAMVVVHSGETVVWVYVTPSGERYHRSDCRYVKGKTTLRQLTVAQAKAEGYTPCKVCKPPE